MPLVQVLAYGSFSFVPGSGFQQGWVLIKPSLMSGAWKAPPGSSWLLLEGPNPCNSTKKKLPDDDFFELFEVGVGATSNQSQRAERAAEELLYDSTRQFFIFFPFKEADKSVLALPPAMALATVPWPWPPAPGPGHRPLALP